MKRHSKIVQKGNTALLVIDMQEKILPVIFENERVVENTLKLINGFKILNVPIFITEQYPKGLGQTEPRIKAAIENIQPIQKMSFSCGGAENLFESFPQQNIKRVVVCGIESHVCVVQTVLDLLVNGFEVSVAADAVSSRRKFDYEIALRRMEANSADITLTESILFEMLNICGSDEFRAVAKLVK